MVFFLEEKLGFAVLYVKALVLNMLVYHEEIALLSHLCPVYLEH